MTHPLRHILLALLAVSLLLMVGLWLGRKPLTNDVLRPWLAEQASQTLDGAVSIDELNLTWGRVEVQGLKLVREDLDARFDSFSIDFTLSGLLQRRLDEIAVVRPEVSLQILPGRESASAPVPILPDRIPLAVSAWSITEGRLRVSLGEENYNVQELNATGHLSETLAFTIACRAGVGAGVALKLIGTGRWQEGLELTLEELVWDNRSLLTDAVTVRPGVTDDLAVEVALSSLSAVEAATLLAASGRPLPWPEDLQWQVTGPKVGLRLIAGVPILHLHTGPGTVTYADRSWPWEATEITLEQTADAWRIDTRFDLVAKTVAAVQGEWRDETFTGHLKASSPQPAALAAAFGFALPADLHKGRDLVISAQLLASMSRSAISDGQLTFGWSELVRISGHFQGDWRGKKATAKVDKLTFTGPLVADVLATAAFELSGDPVTNAWQGSWKLASNDLRALIQQAGVTVADNLPNLHEVQLSGGLNVLGDRLSLPEIKMEGRLEGKGLTGRLHSQLAVSLLETARPLLELQELSLAELEYSNTDGTVVVVGGRLALSGQVRSVAETVDFNLRGKGTLDEALVNSWYGTLKELPLTFTSRGRWLQKEQTLQFDQAGFDFAGLVSTELDGRLSMQTAALNGRLAVPQMAGRFLETLKQLRGELFPSLNDLVLDGALGAQFRIVRQEAGWRLGLELHPDEMSIGLGEAFSVSGLHGTLPFILQMGIQPEPAPERSDRLLWRRLKAPLIDTQEGLLELCAGANSWQLIRPLEIAVAGGRARLNTLRLSWQDLKPAGEAALSIEEIDLLELSRTLDWPELNGRFSATLGGIRFSEEAVVTSGEASAWAFGGTVRLHNLKVLAPLSRYPTYHADIDFSDIDLHALTSTFAFGEINGVASGHVRDLRLFDGIPSAFDARFETAASGTRNISVKAIRNLNTLSHGGLSAALSQGIYRFIDFYHYRKIGFSCSLRNDAFHLLGTARTASDQYLIDGGLLPPKIDVTVSSPNISFKEMVRRLKRIERTDR